MDEKSSRGLSRKIADRDLVAVHDKLQHLDHHIADEKRAERGACRVPRHPVDHAEADERCSDIAREHFRLGGNTETEAREHRRGKNEEPEAEDSRGDAADHEREARAHGAESNGPPVPVPSA
jgi:hypothetical protein